MGPIADPAALAMVWRATTWGSCCQHVNETVYLYVLFGFEHLLAKSPLDRRANHLSSLFKSMFMVTIIS